MMEAWSYITFSRAWPIPQTVLSSVISTKPLDFPNYEKLEGRNRLAFLQALLKTYKWETGFEANDSAEVHLNSIFNHAV